MNGNESGRRTERPAGSRRGRPAGSCADPGLFSRVHDVIILGGGILGTMTAWKLSRYDLDVVVLDRAYDVGEGSAKANSGILYPGFQHRGGSLKGISCVRGSRMYDEICRDLDIPMKRVGALYVTFHEEGDHEMRKKYQRGLENGTPGMEILSGREARRMEPLLSKKVRNALYTPSVGILSPFTLIISLAEAAAENGVKFLFGCEAEGIELPQEEAPTAAREKGREAAREDAAKEFPPIRVVTPRGTLSSRFLVNTAGENAAELEGFVRPRDLVIRPRRGQFYVFDKQETPVLRHVIYQAQETDEGGTLIAPPIEGNLIAGPTSENVRSYQNTDTTREGLAHVERVAKKILPDLDMGRVITNFAGVRANITNVDKEHKDFVLRRSAPRMVSALGIKNPGMTAAPYLAESMIALLREEGLVTEEKADYRPRRKRQKPFLQSDRKEQQALYAKDPRYARVICRCEGITEGDLLHVLHSPLPPASLNGFKKRLRTGMGRCQGSFCTSRILEIVCRETGCLPEEFCKSTEGSRLVKGRLK